MYLFIHSEKSGGHATGSVLFGVHSLLHCFAPPAFALAFVRRCNFPVIVPSTERGINQNDLTLHAAAQFFLCVARTRTIWSTRPRLLNHGRDLQLDTTQVGRSGNAECRGHASASLWILIGTNSRGSFAWSACSGKSALLCHEYATWWAATSTRLHTLVSGVSKFIF